VTDPDLINTTHECVIVVPEVVAFGGAERSVLALAQWLHRHSLRHRILMYRDQIGLATYAQFPLVTTVLNPSRGPIAKTMALRRFFKSQNNIGFAPLMSGYQAALHASLARLRGFHTLMHDTPSLFSDHNQPVSLTQKLRRSLAAYALRRGLGSGGQAIVTSEYLAAETQQLYGCRATIIRMGGMGQGEVFRPRIADKQMRILSVSRLEDNKRVDWILRALGQLEASTPALSHTIGWEFDIVGDGSIASDLKSLSKKLGIAARTNFHGFVGDTALTALFDQAHLFVMPSRQGYGIPAIEALQRGIPVLLHRESGVSDILRDTPWCVVTEGGEEHFPAALKASIQSVIEGRHVSVPLPTIPTEDGWAETVARACGWWR
jgi:glycosyltransferase involved in cell wall biosynthesis